MILLLATAVVVGVCIGAAGVGGVLLIPALQMLTPLSVHASMATALFTFIFTGIFGTWLFQRRGSIAWHLTVPLCVGGSLFGIVGSFAAARLDGRVLSIVLAVLIVLAGIYTVLGSRVRTAAPFEGQLEKQRAVLFCVGAVTGFGSGLTGVGGPALAVPLMVLLGFPAIVAVGASQVVQIVASVSGSLGNLGRGTVDLALVMWLTVFEIAGVWGGVNLAHRIDPRTLRLAVGLLCISVGIGLLVRTH
jgi:uncharacterized protein